MSKPSFHSAELDWIEGGQPFSSLFADVYFSRDAGLDETRHVFLQHNRLPERWQALPHQAQFCIAETGFGTGLNFIAAWQLWDQLAPPDAQLHFVSTEKYPLTPEDLRRALALWPELSPWSDQLLAQYNGLAPGWQHFNLAQGRVTLTLLIGDLFDTLPQLDARVDAWFLDGFAPAKNPDMWQPALYQRMAELSTEQATVATFTSVGEVRRGLQAAGFSMRKVKGFGRKREMLSGELNSRPALPWQAPWYARPIQAERSADHVLVIGGGLAGCSTAHALARRGWRVTLLERHAELAQQASGNAQGILYAKLSPHHPPLSRFIQACYQYSLRLLDYELADAPDAWQACGVLQLAKNEKEAARQTQLAAQGYPPDFLQAVDQKQAGELAGVSVSNGGLFFPAAGWVNPPSLCRQLASHPLVQLHSSAQAEQLQRVDGLWQVRDAQGKVLASAPVAVICAAQDSTRFTQSSHLPLKAIRGQITHLPVTADSSALRSVLCADGYISPARQAEHHLGASFRFDRLDNEPSSEENLSNLDLLAALSPQLEQCFADHRTQAGTLPARAALRCTAPDYLPLIGPLADPLAFAERYAVLAKDASQRPAAEAPWYENLYINAAHGSRGLISCPLGAELVAAWITGEPLPLPQDLAAAVHPNRFMLRRLIRGQAADRQKAGNGASLD
ncbi:MAG: bifunctional tRNA (5-methylaminomethyl-2-thiouridine)(34)-methyltransferase MnmD/FAD-dependent 5-carboxymethylaminomethyl-2-thiouridine(34) oxidoreductase MnmC [Halopseudomonas sp.]|uniref:bifunctional tRNA (5-methylaminomethyl-2-thiouridine)(34)-methyltransferase MnmD/FAD-dependent 5-carboxymethylaminomethyl-2-thiouridine(34) oxidoreductase MnmC n=1 Tax=Halopseudomonas sp. TaxID=2901191 RepID=UPI0030025496